MVSETVLRSLQHRILNSYCWNCNRFRVTTEGSLCPYQSASSVTGGSTTPATASGSMPTTAVSVDIIAYRCLLPDLPLTFQDVDFTIMRIWTATMWIVYDDVWWGYHKDNPFHKEEIPPYTLWISQHSYGKSPFFMGKSTINGDFPHSYVKLPEGTSILAPKISHSAATPWVLPTRAAKCWFCAKRFPSECRSEWLDEATWRSGIGQPNVENWPHKFDRMWPRILDFTIFHQQTWESCHNQPQWDSEENILLIQWDFLPSTRWIHQKSVKKKWWSFAIFPGIPPKPQKSVKTCSFFNICFTFFQKKCLKHLRNPLQKCQSFHHFSTKKCPAPAAPAHVARAPVARAWAWEPRGALPPSPDGAGGGPRVRNHWKSMENHRTSYGEL